MIFNWHFQENSLPQPRKMLRWRPIVLLIAENEALIQPHRTLCRSTTKWYLAQHSCCCSINGTMETELIYHPFSHTLFRDLYAHPNSMEIQWLVWVFFYYVTKKLSSLSLNMLLFLYSTHVQDDVISVLPFKFVLICVTPFSLFLLLLNPLFFLILTHYPLVQHTLTRLTPESQVCQLFSNKP